MASGIKKDRHPSHIQMELIPRKVAMIESNEWYTPDYIMDKVRGFLGRIDLDPASTELANTVVRADRFFTAQDNALLPSRRWAGSVWLNPPYSNPLIQQFIHKMNAQYDKGNISRGLLLTNNNTETEWWHEAADKASAILFFRSRIFFWRPDREKASSPRQGQTLFCYGNVPLRFKKYFGDCGIIK